MHQSAAWVAELVSRGAWTAVVKRDRGKIQRRVRIDKELRACTGLHRAIDIVGGLSANQS
jgi:hypothetical protein